MKIIKTKVIGDTITPIEQGYVIENQVNQYAIEFDFDETWNFEEKYCIFQDEFEEQTFKRAIINNQVIVPSELLNGRITIQVYGQNIENNVISQRQPSLKYVFSILNSLPANASEEQSTPTPTQWELYISQIEDMCNDLQEQFDDLKEDCEQKCNDVIDRVEKAEQDIQTNTDNIRTNAEAIDKLNTDLLDYSLITETGNKISMSINSQTYVITLSLKDKNDNILSTQSVDLPLETMIVSASYSNGILTFTLKNGQTLQVPISDLINGLVSTDTFNQAVQSLSNRISTIENDYLKASDKTELQNQITANADDIGNIQEEQLTQNADIESLQQENERLSRIVSGLPTKQASGTSFVLNDMVKANIKDYELRGNTIQNGTPTPESPIEIQTVTGNQEINFCGKNLFNPALYEDNKYQNYSPTNMTIANNNNWWITGYQLIKPNTTYTKSSLVSGGVIYDKDKNALRTLTGNAYTFTTPDNAYYVCFTILKSSLLFNGNIQLELGETATNYEPFKQTTKTISLGTIELNKIGNYQDRIYKQGNKWYLHKEIGKQIFNGTETYTIGNELTNTIDYRINTSIGAIATGYDEINFYNNRFIRQAGATTDIECSWLNRLGYIRFRINKTTASTIEKFKEWVSNNNIIVYFILATPTDTEITDTSLISQLEDIYNIILNENNTIIINGNLPSDTLVIGYADIAKLISSLSSQDNRSVEENTRKGGNTEEPKEEKEPVEEPIETKEEER